MTNQRQTSPRARILILDQDRVFAQSLAAFLSKERYSVTCIASVDEARQTLQVGGIDLLLVDINIPGIKPPDLLRELRQHYPAVVTIVLTGYGSIENAVQAVKLGAFEYLTKPVVDDEISQIIAKAVRQQALVHENLQLKRSLDDRYGLGSIVGRDRQMLRIFELLEAVADSRTTVLITGESGTGKSLLARTLHQQSPRRDKPFIEVSCGALPETLLESELFGHVKGAFTGAAMDKVGRFLAANGGTLFLDEINSATPLMQVKLLRILQDKAFEPVGSTQTTTVDVRVVLATNMDLTQLVAEGKFRQDLYYRINVVGIRVPSLRERASDIPLLAERFLAKYAAETKRSILGFSEPAIATLLRYHWPGNVRELENAIERAVVLCRRPQIELEDLPEHIQLPAPLRITAGAGHEAMSVPNENHPLTLEAALEGPERLVILAALKRNSWSRQATAAELNINRTTLYKKMRKYHLDAEATPGAAA